MAYIEHVAIGSEETVWGVYHKGRGVGLIVYSDEMEARHRKGGASPTSSCPPGRSATAVLTSSGLKGELK